MTEKTLRTRNLAEHFVVLTPTSGAEAVVPRGTWHTARVRLPTSMWFITPGEGTENRDSLPWEER